MPFPVQDASDQGQVIIQVKTNVDFFGMHSSGTEQLRKALVVEIPFRDGNAIAVVADPVHGPQCLARKPSILKVVFNDDIFCYPSGTFQEFDAKGIGHMMQYVREDQYIKACVIKRKMSSIKLGVFRPAWLLRT